MEERQANDSRGEQPEGPNERSLHPPNAVVKGQVGQVGWIWIGQVWQGGQMGQIGR